MMSIGTPEEIVHRAPRSTSPGSARVARRDEAVPAIVRRRAELAPQIVRIDRSVQERDLIVVGIVEGLGQRVAQAKGVAAGYLPLRRQEQGVILGLGARFDVDHPLEPADHGVEHFADRYGR